MATIEDLVVEPDVAAVEEIAQLHGWLFERVAARCFRVSLSARNGDMYQIEVEFDGYPAMPAAFHWRNQQTGQLDELADTPAPFSFFHSTGRICAPWNRLASTPGGPHTNWVQTNWQQQSETRGTVRLAAMVLRIHFELRSQRYRGRRK